MLRPLTGRIITQVCCNIGKVLNNCDYETITADGAAQSMHALWREQNTVKQ